MVSFYSWSSSSSDHLPTVFCLCSAPFIHFLPDLKYFSSASIEVHFPWNKVYLSLLSLFKRKEEKLSVWSLSLFTLSWLPFFFHSDIWYFDNFKLIICLHCNHSLILQIDYFSVPGKVIIVLLFNHNHCHISLEALYCCCNHLQPGLRLLTFSCNFLKYASGIVVQGPFVSIYQVHFSQRFYWPSLVWAATSPKKGSFSDRTCGMTIPDGWLTRTVLTD